MIKYFFESINDEEVTTRSQNVIKDLGGIKPLLDYFKKHNSFLAIPTVGRETNEELTDFCKCLLANKPEAKEKEIPAAAILVPYHPLPTGLMENLSKKAVHFVMKKGGIEQLLGYFKIHRSFIGIGAGKLLNDELTAFCEHQVWKDESGITDEIIENNDEASFIKFIEVYEAQKEFLSVRARNILDRVEFNYDYHSGASYKTDFIKKVFLKYFDFSRFQNAGYSALKELQLLKHEILAANNTDVITGKKPLRPKIRLMLDRTFSMDRDEAVTDELFINDEYSFAKMFCIFLLSHDRIRDKKLTVMNHRYFSDEPYNKKIIAAELKCTKQNLEHISGYLRNKCIPYTVNAVQDISGYKPYDWPADTGGNIMTLEHFQHFIFKNIHYTPNAELSKITYGHILGKNYELIDSFISRRFKTLQTPGINLFVRKEFIEKVQLQKALEWLDEEIYKSESVSLQYMTDEVIKKFYTEHNLSIGAELLHDLYSVIKIIKKEKSEIILKPGTHWQKRNLVDSILNETCEFLRQKKTAQNTEAIRGHLRNKNFEIERHKLTSYLRGRKDTFLCFGHGTWLLSEWNNDGKITGSFKKIIKTLLINRTEPIHISEIHEYLNAIKKVSFRSIRENLRNIKDGTFRLFNCSYIGLAANKYSDYWYHIPKFNDADISKKLTPADYKEDSEIAKYISSKCGYPEQHVLFILRRRKIRYE